jgi:hypothetical protein
MKYIKTYEDIKDEPVVNDYVYCGIPGIDNKGNNKDIYDFITTHIGQLVKITDDERPIYYIHYENIPIKIRWNSEYRYANSILDEEPFRRHNITEWAKTLEELKMKLESKKYNL